MIQCTRFQQTNPQLKIMNQKYPFLTFFSMHLRLPLAPLHTKRFRQMQHKRNAILFSGQSRKNGSQNLYLRFVLLNLLRHPQRHLKNDRDVGGQLTRIVSFFKAKTFCGEQEATMETQRLILQSQSKRSMLYRCINKHLATQQQITVPVVPLPTHKAFLLSLPLRLLLRCHTPRQFLLLSSCLSRLLPTTLGITQTFQSAKYLMQAYRVPFVKNTSSWPCLLSTTTTFSWYVGIGGLSAGRTQLKTRLFWLPTTMRLTFQRSHRNLLVMLFWSLRFRCRCSKKENCGVLHTWMEMWSTVCAPISCGIRQRITRQKTRFTH